MKVTQFLKLQVIITPVIGVSISGPSVISPYTSEQLRISGNISASGISKNLKLNKNKLNYKCSKKFDYSQRKHNAFMFILS